MAVNEDTLGHMRLAGVKEDAGTTVLKNMGGKDPRRRTKGGGLNSLAGFPQFARE